MWQPIETAPKDGTVILVWNGIQATTAAWFYSFLDEQTGEVRDHWRTEIGDTYEGQPTAEVGSWLVYVNGELVDDGTWDHGTLGVEPTHWMPLPDPPA